MTSDPRKDLLDALEVMAALKPWIGTADGEGFLDAFDKARNEAIEATARYTGSSSRPFT